MEILNRLDDEMSIATLIRGWMFRDLGRWDRLRELFHPEGTIEVTWFEGLFKNFVTASETMGASNIRTKHVITNPMVTIANDRAITETNIIIVGQNMQVGLGCEAHARFYDLVEKRDGVWRILHRYCIYDMGGFTFPSGIVAIDSDIVARYPVEYASLAYLLEVSGFPVKRVFPTRGSEAERLIREDSEHWLTSGRD